MSKTPTPREAAQLAEALAHAAAADPSLKLEMTRDQLKAFKKQLWWGREIYSPTGLAFIFPGLKGAPRGKEDDREAGRRLRQEARHQGRVEEGPGAGQEAGPAAGPGAEAEEVK
jgi:hypothetical protein